METIAYIGMDVHTTNYTLCAFKLDGTAFGMATIMPELKELEKYFTTLNKRNGITHFECGYEAGCLGYSLWREIMSHKWNGYDVSCSVIAPTTIPVPAGGRIKTDKRDAKLIGQSMLNGTCSYIYIPDPQDEAVKEYIRMRDDTQTQLKATKQQIIAMCIRQGKYFQGKTYWTAAHLEWLKKLSFSNPLFREVLNEYLLTYQRQTESVEAYDKRIEELAQDKKYAEHVKKLGCLKGIATHTAMSLIVEVGDFRRFPKAENFSAYLGLVPDESSSSDKIHRGSITKRGNVHLRRLLVESANCFSHTRSVTKSKVLKARQAGNSKEVIAYADKANERLRKRYTHLALSTKPCIAKVAIARELSCFIWGLMTEHTA